MPRPRAATFFSAALALVGLVGCQNAEPAPSEVRLGVIAPLSGSLAARVGSYAREGAQLAAEEHNEAGGLLVDGRRLPLELLFEDSRDRHEASVHAARKLINQDRVAALLGPFLSRNALAAAATADTKAMPMISPASTHMELTADRRCVFRATIMDDLQGRALALFVHEDLEARRGAVLYDVASAHNRSVARLFRQVFEEAGGEVVAFEGYLTGEHDFRAPLERIRKAKPDVLLLPNYADETPLQARQAREAGIEAVLLGSDSWDAEIYPGLAEFDGAYFTDDWLPDIPELASPESDAFSKSYTRRHGRPSTSISALAYDALGLLASAIERAGSLEAEAICTALRTTSGYRGVTGTLSFQGHGDPLKAVNIFKIEDGRYRFHKRILP